MKICFYRISISQHIVTDIKNHVVQIPKKSVFHVFQEFSQFLEKIENKMFYVYSSALRVPPAETRLTVYRRFNNTESVSR